MKKELKLGRLIKIIHNTFETELNNQLKKYDLTKVQCDVLIYLDRNKEKEVSQRDIEKFFGISNPTVSGILGRLEQKGLIQRMVSSKDARFKYIEQTEKARQLHQKLKSNLENMEQKLRADLTDEEITTLQYLLEKILYNISN